MLAKRIIPCLDILNGRTVKGVNFVELRDAGDPAELAATYAEQGADELVLLDIAATAEQRKTTTQVVREVAHVINIPFTVGGGINSVEDAGSLLEAGADKVSVNSSAVYRPELINELTDHFGSQCIVVAIDAKKIDNQWMVHAQGGKKATEKKLFSWAKEAAERGAGELLFTSMDHDGTTQGFAIDALAKLCRLVHVPVIASGGAGSMAHFAEVFLLARVQAALAASVFHYGTIAIPELKKFLLQQNLIMRI